MEAAKETKFGTKVYSLGDEDDARTSNTRIAQIKRAIPHSTMKTNRNMTSVLVTALCNQPEACASDLGDGSHVTCYYDYYLDHQ